MGLSRAKRQQLAELVFSDPQKLRELNQLVHPKLKKTIFEKLKIRKFDSRMIVINAAVLKEIGLIGFCDEVWVVMASKKTRLARLLEKGLSKEAALARINSQMGQKNYLKLADVVIDNNGTRKELNGQVQALFKL